MYAARLIATTVVQYGAGAYELQVLQCKACLAGSTFHSKLKGGCLPAADLPITVCPAAVQTAVRQLQKCWCAATCKLDCWSVSMIVRQRTLVIVFMPTVEAVKLIG